MTKRMRSRVQAADMGFLPKVRDLSALDKVKSTDICQSLNIEPLLLRIERSQLRWYGHVTRMSHKQTAKQEDDPDLSGEIMLKTSTGHVVELTKLPLVARDRDA